MKERDKKTLASALMSTAPDLKRRGRSGKLLKTPLRRIFRGYSLSGSMVKNHCYVHAILLPLYVPNDVLALTFGERLHHDHDELWDASLADTLAEAAGETWADVLESVQTPEDFADWASPRIDFDRPSYPLIEAYAYSLVAAGDQEQGVNMLRRFLSMEAMRNPKYAHSEETKARAETLLKLAETDMEAADRQLREWEEFTVKSLKLEEFRA